MSLALRIGSVPYLNAEPLLDGLDVSLRVEPARLTLSLLEGEVDLAVLPVGAALAHDLRVLRSCGVASDGPVNSVFLLHDGPFREVRLVHPDPASVSSNLLARILVERSGSGQWAETSLEYSQAHVLIGDPALRLEHWTGTDLGEAWKRWTGLPFVFAAWVIGPHVPEQDWNAVDRTLQAAAERGTSALEKCASEQQVVASDRALEYLKGLRYHLDSSYHEGMNRYAQEAQRLGIGSGQVRFAC
jgi:chorismate dehydratase